MNYLDTIIGKVNYLPANSKLNKTSKLTGLKVYNFGTPAKYSKRYKMITCAKFKACGPECYADQGAYKWPSVSNAYENRLGASLDDGFVDAMNNAISKKRKITHVRIHDSGDFYNAEYLNKWIAIAHDNKEVIFYAYTKEVALLKRYAPIMPSNMIVIYSFGGKEDHLIDVSQDRHSVVFDDTCPIPTDYIDASENDLQAIGDNKKIGLHYHGQKTNKGFMSVLKSLGFMTQEVA